MTREVEIKEGRYDPPRSASELAKCPYRLAYEHLYRSRDDAEEIAATPSHGSLIHRTPDIAASHGLLIHRKLDIELERDGVKYKCVKEVEAPRRYGLAARVDYLCRRGDETVVVELKTAKREFIDEHVRQVRIYMLLLNANKGLIVYVTRSSKPEVLDVVEVNTPMSEDELIDLMRKHALVEPIPGSYCELCPIKTCKRRTLRPQSQDKLALSIAASSAGRMGVLAKSPLGSYLITTMVLQSANNWYHMREIANTIKRSIAATIYRSALAKLGPIKPMDRAKVNALANAATKVALNAMRGALVVPAEQALEDALQRANENIGAPQEYINAVKKATLAYLGQVPGGTS